MSFDMMHCGLCNLRYNSIDRLPRILGSCFHTFCTPCIMGLLQNSNCARCPLDGMLSMASERGIETFLVNTSLKVLLEKLPEVCQEHEEEARFVCLTDRVQICDYCIDSGSHRNHEVKSIQKIKVETDRKSKGLEVVIKDIDRYCTGIEEILQQEKTMLLKSVGQRFQQLKWLILKKELEFSFKINSFFEIEENKLKENLGPNSNRRKILLGMIADLKDVRNGDFLKVMQEDLSHILSSFNTTSLQNKTQDFIQEMKQYSESVDLFLTSKAEELSRLELPIGTFPEKLGQAYFETDKGEVSKNVYSSLALSQVNNVLQFKQQEDGQLLISPRDPSQLMPNTDTISDMEEWNVTDKVCLKLGKLATTEKNIQALLCVWSKLENVSTLKIDLNSNEFSDSQLLNILPVLFWRTKGLKNISINLDSCKVGDGSMVALADDYLSKMKDLTSLSLNLNRTYITNRSIEKLAKNIQPIARNLEYLKLGFWKTKITDQSTGQLFFGMENLKNFLIDLDCTEVGDATVESFVKNTLPTLKGLEEFQFCLSETKVTDKSIAKMFVSMPYVKTFVLGLGGTQITDISFEAFLTNTQKTMINLECFSMCIWETKISDSLIKEMFYNIKHLKLLKLYFGSLDISNSTLEVFASDVLPWMKSLEEIELNLKYTSVTDEGVSQIFVEMPSVKTFSLNLNGNPIGNKSIEAFTQNTLHTMNNLETISISLRGSHVTDDSIVPLLTAIRSTKVLRLCLQDTEVTDKTVDAFLHETFPQLKMLEDFDIDLTNTKVTDKARVQLNEAKRIYLKLT